MTSTTANIVGIQMAQARKVIIGGRAVMTAIHKTPVEGAVAIGPLGLQGDEQADLTVHGGLDKAVYAYPAEHYDFWRKARAKAGVGGIDDALPFGAMGENLTLQGLLESDVWIGDVLQFPDCVLRVSQPRQPCFKFNAAMGFNQATKVMAQSGFCGYYLAVDTPGTLRAGDACTLVPGSRQVSIPARFQSIMFKG
ncbi:MAG: MOSC domain-containing protein [Rhodoferax sp.]|nr:MOSC domain-containing protein [Rhodoferax sp.]